MGTNVLAFCSHNFPTKSGSEILREFETRFNHKCHQLTMTSENNHVPGRWRVIILDHDNINEEWAKTNHLEFDCPAINQIDDQDVTLWGPLAELGDNNWSDWTFFVHTFIDLTTKDDYQLYWQKYRTNIYSLMKKVGGDRVLFVGDKDYEDLLFVKVKEDSLYNNEPDEYPTFEEMIGLAHNNRLNVFYHPVTTEQLENLTNPNISFRQSILIDDFADLKLL